jgi:hypothetical protein
MIISHKHKFIFMKTKKTAGTSVEIALSEFLGDDDIITPLSDNDEQTRADLGYTCARNYCLPFSSYQAKDWGRLLLQRRRLRYYPHTGAARIRKLIGDDIWNSYYKFSFERNPWDKVISSYYWRARVGGRRAPLSEFIKRGRFAQMSKNGGSGVYTIKGKIAVDRVCLFENIEEEMNFIAGQLKLPGIPKLPKTKSGTRKDKRHYRDILTDDDRLRIQEAFATEIENFGYKF